MAGSSIGWEDLPYARLPLPLDGSKLEWRELEPIAIESGALPVVLISGACSATDVMRGEETELVGLFTLSVAERLAEQSLVIMPGTHSKHLHVADGQMVGMQTFMTGELRDVLGKHSVLAHSVEAASMDSMQNGTGDDLRAGVRHALSLPLGAALFRVRTRQLLDGFPGANNRAFLDGVLLGGELGYLLAGEFREIPLLLCATSPAEANYRAALEELQLLERSTMVSPDEVDTLSARGQAVLGRQLGLV
jgi:2-dehydro-3-deoxygalactonokinase